MQHNIYILTKEKVGFSQRIPLAAIDKYCFPGTCSQKLFAFRWQCQRTLSHLYKVPMTKLMTEKNPGLVLNNTPVPLKS